MNIWDKSKLRLTSVFGRYRKWSPTLEKRTITHLSFFYLKSDCISWQEKIICNYVWMEVN